MNSDDMLKLENQLCFPLYAAAKDVVGRYKPLLDALDLTYTQYITMMVLWDRLSVSEKELGSALFLDSGTLTPLIKRLEGKGFIKRERSATDERIVNVTLTDDGAKLKEKARDIPARLAGCLPLAHEEAGVLYRLLYKILRQPECARET